MTLINLPWFPGGDPLTPVERSPLHCYYYDYYQTYDLFLFDCNFPLQFYLALRSRLVDLGCDLPRFDGQEYRFVGIERFNPHGAHDYFWIDRFYNWCKSWVGIDWLTVSFATNFPVPESPTEIYIPADTEITYLTLGNVRGTDHWYNWVTERVLVGQWTPRYLPVVNSMTWLIEDLEIPHELWRTGDFPLQPYDRENEDPNLTIQRRLISRIETAISTRTETQNLVQSDTICCIPTANTTTFIEWVSDISPDWTPIDEGYLVSSEQTDACSSVQVVVVGVADLEQDGSIVGLPDTIPPNIDWVMLRIEALADSEASFFIAPGETVDSQTTTSDLRYLDPSTIDDPIFVTFGVLLANNNYWGNGILREIDRLGRVPAFWSAATGVPRFQDLVLGPPHNQDPSQRLLSQVRIFGDNQRNTVQSGSPVEFRSAINCGLANYFPVATTTVYGSVISVLTRDANLFPDLIDDSLKPVLSPIGIIDAWRLRLTQIDGNLELAEPMPDSLRVKEIHKALEAGYWSNPIDPEPVFGLTNGYLADSARAEEIINSILDPTFEPEKPSNLATYIQTAFKLLGVFLGAHNFPMARVPSWQPSNLRDNKTPEPERIDSLVDYLATSDYETQIKLGVFPLVTYNWAALTEDMQPSEVVYPNIGDLTADLYALCTRGSTLWERSALSAYRTDANVIEVAKAIGTPFKRFESVWDYGRTDLLQFAGASTIAGAIAGISVYLAENAASTLPVEINEMIQMKRQSLTQPEQGG